MNSKVYLLKDFTSKASDEARSAAEENKYGRPGNIVMMNTCLRLSFSHENMCVAAQDIPNK